MTILTAGLKSNVYDAAREYLIAGVSILPVKDKKPNLKGELWRQWMHHRPTLKTLDYWEKEGLLTGIAVICGKVSRNLVVLDFDSFLMMDEFTAEFPHLQDTYVVASGSRRGAHFYYYVDALPQPQRIPFELRAHGCYVVAPPSLHSSGLNYIVAGQREPMHLHHMGDVVRWMKAKTERLAPEKKLPAPKSPTARPVGNKNHISQRDEYFKRLYVQGALDKQLRILRNATEGQRNDLLLVSAIALGQLVGARALDRSKAEKELYTAAMQVGLEQKETLATIKSGLDIGEKSPRNIPPAPPKLSNQN